MRIDRDVIAQAFQKNYDTYVVETGWPVKDIAKLWSYGQQAFAGNGDEIAFKALYDELKGHWQVFRGSSDTEPDRFRRVQNLMMSITGGSPALGKVRLSDLSSAHLPDLKRVLADASRIKVNKSGPSLVAATKFLHTWNPSLFVIVDGGIMDHRVFGHRWLRDEAGHFQRRFQHDVSALNGGPTLQTSHGLSYIGILFWAGQLMRQYPEIRTAFADRVRSAPGVDPGLHEFEDFEGAAFEWFLRGVVELPQSATQ